MAGYVEKNRAAITHHHHVFVARSATRKLAPGMEALRGKDCRHIDILVDGREAMVRDHNDVGRVTQPFLVERGKDLGQVLIRVLDGSERGWRAWSGFMLRMIRLA